MKRRKSGNGWPLWLFSASLALGAPSAALAQPQEESNPGAAQRAQASDYQINPGPLSSALLQFSRQSGVQLLAPDEITAGLQSNGLKGHYTPTQALNLLLTGTSLTFAYTGANTIRVYAAPPATGTGQQLLAPVRVEGARSEASGFALGGNGSHDVTATEDSGSLNGPMLSIGSKGATTVKDTPQTVTVITNEQLKQQNVQNLDEAMQQAPGILVQQGGNSMSQTFWSRGYQITRLQLDGGSPIEIGSDATTNHRFQPFFDMSMYDHVEVLRGADGLFSGSGVDPGGTINLVRKRPLDHFRASFEGKAGSWDNYRSSIDITGPLGLDGHLRGRTVLTWQDRNYFYDTAKDDNRLLFGSLEADLTDTTLLEVGGSYTRVRGTPWWNGLPFYADGRDPGFPRSTALTYPWSRLNSDTRETFVKLSQKLGGDWSANLRYTRLDQSNDILSTGFDGSIPTEGDPVMTLSTQANTSQSVQDALDFDLNGGFDLFGLRQRLVFGGNFSKVNSSFSFPSYPGSITYPLPDGYVRVLPFDPNLPMPTLPEGTYAINTTDDLRQWGLYARAEIKPWEPLSLITGLRLDSYSTDTLNYYSPTFERTTSSGREMQRPYYAIRYDITRQWSTYASYTDVYQPQLSLIAPGGNPIAPMTGSNYETGLKYQSDDGLLNASLALYRIERSGVGIQINPDEQPEDLGNGRWGYYVNSTTPDLSRGVDLEVTGQLTPYWQASFGYTFNINQQGGAVDSADRGRPVQTFFPRHTLKLWNSFQPSGSPLLDKLQFGLGVIAKSNAYVSGVVERKECGDFDFTCQMQEYRALIPGYAVVSGRIAYQLTDNWNLALNVDNIFDRRYYSTIGGTAGGYWYGEPRNYMLTLTGLFQ